MSGPMPSPATSPSTPSKGHSNPAAVLDFESLEEIVRQRATAFAAAEPFPHTVIDGFLPAETAEKVLAEFPAADNGWTHYHHYNERKRGLTDVEKMGPTTQKVFEALCSSRFRGIVETLTGIKKLITDPDLEGAGLHETLPGGFLNIHTDFLAHNVHRHWSRQVNLLVYLNKDWKEAWNGNLEIWDAEMTQRAASVVPAFNRCVIFHTQRRSFHGHPHKLTCPPDRSRKSLILYYYRDEAQVQRLEPTLYEPLPDDPAFKKALVWADWNVIRAYSFLKRYAGLRDGVSNRFLKNF